MSELPLDRIAEALRAARACADPLSQARAEDCPDPALVLQTLDQLRTILLDQSPTERLRADLERLQDSIAELTGLRQAQHLLGELPEIRQCIALDLEAAFHGDPAAKTYAEILASYPSVIAVSTYRIAHAFYRFGFPVVARIMSEEAHSRTGVDIHPGARIGCHLFIDHGTGVVIGETTEIGNRVKLYHGVTLGAFSNRHGRGDTGKKRHPTIEDDVTIYPNATILGGDTVVGHHCTIGGNVWLIESLPPHTRVTIEPPSLQKRQRGGTHSDYDI